jgi:hypothetical protein
MVVMQVKTPASACRHRKCGLVKNNGNTRIDRNLKFNGQRIDSKSIIAETSADLVRKNGKITVGNLRRPNSELLQTWPPDNMGTQEGFTGAHIHTHPNIRSNGAYTWGSGIGAQTRNVYASDGPSAGDQSTTGENIRFSNIRNVVADRNYIYLINGNDNQTIKIPR